MGGEVVCISMSEGAGVFLTSLNQRKKSMGPDSESWEPRLRTAPPIKKFRKLSNRNVRFKRGGDKKIPVEEIGNV